MVTSTETRAWRESNKKTRLFTDLPVQKGRKQVLRPVCS